MSETILEETSHIETVFEETDIKKEKCGDVFDENDLDEEEVSEKYSFLIKLHR